MECVEGAGCTESVGGCSGNVRGCQGCLGNAQVCSGVLGMSRHATYSEL